MNYEQKYKEALGWMQSLYDGLHGVTKEDAEHYFPELVESEDDRIRKEIISALKYANYKGVYNKHLAWLEKQGEHKPYGQRKECEDCQFNYAGECKGYCALKRNEQTQFDYEHAYIPKKDFAPIEPKFKVRDWLQYRYAEPFLVEEITEQGYCNGNSCLPFEWEDEIHLWTIQDAKDGDVLATEDGRPFIIRCMVESKNDIPSAYCGINARPIEAFIITGYSPGTSKWTNSKVHPATKEQRDLLFEKMKEAGYEWDADKKELRKIDTYQLNENPCSDCTNTKGCITCVNGDQKSTSAPRMLYSDEVIEWLDDNICNAYDYDGNDISTTLKSKFKQYFGLC